MKKTLLLATFILFILSNPQTVEGQEPTLNDVQEGSTAGNSVWSDRKKTVSAPFYYDDGSRNYRYPVPVNFDFAYIDNTGKVVIRGPFGCARSFSNERAAVYFSPYDFADGNWSLNLKHIRYKNWMFIDTNGVVITEPVYRDVKPFVDDLTTVQTERLHSQFIDKSGKVLREFEKQTISDMSEGLAAFHENDLRKGYLDAQGTIVIQPNFDEAGAFHEGLAAACPNATKFPIPKIVATASRGLGHYGFIDKTGSFVITPQFQHAEQFHNGLAAAIKNEKWGLIDRAGKTVIPFAYDWAGAYAEDLIPVESDKKVGYINRSNSTVIPFKFAFASEFREGKAAATIDGINWGFINTRGDFVIPPIFLRTLPFNNGRALVYIKHEDRKEFTPGEAPYFYWSACQSRLKLDLEGARAAYKMAIEIAPSSDWAKRSRCFLESSMPKSVIPKEILEVYGRSLREPNPRKAIDDLKTCIEKQPDFPWLYAAIAGLYISQQQFDKAELALNTVIAKEPKYARAYYWMSVISEHRGEREKSQMYLSKASKLNPYDEVLQREKQVSPTKNE